MKSPVLRIWSHVILSCKYKVGIAQDRDQFLILIWKLSPHKSTEFLHVAVI